MASEGGSPSALAYIEIARRLGAKLQAGAAAGAAAGPRIVVE